MSLHPVAYQPKLIVDFIYYILHHHAAPTTLVICSERAAFLPHLHASAVRANVATSHDQNHDGDEQSSQEQAREHPLLALHDLSTIFASQSVTVVFCGSVPSLHAYLTTLPGKNTVPWPGRSRGGDGAPGAETSEEKQSSIVAVPTLALVNLVDLHADTASFSAQGLSRAYAAAVEAAERSQQRLVLFESLDHPPVLPDTLAAWWPFAHADDEEMELDYEEEYDEDDYAAAAAMQDMDLQYLAHEEEEEDQEYEEMELYMGANNAGMVSRSGADVQMAAMQGQAQGRDGGDDAFDEGNINDNDKDDDSNNNHGQDKFTASHSQSQFHAAAAAAAANATANDKEDRDRDPWAIEIPMVNSTTKSYGPARQKGGDWIGKKVTVADVAARWCTFEDLPTNS